MSNVPETRSKHERAPPSSPVLVWNGLVTRIRPIGTERQEEGTSTPRATESEDEAPGGPFPGPSRAGRGVRVP